MTPDGLTRISYFKRFKMEMDLQSVPAPVLPPGYRFVPWSPELLETHAQVLCHSFHDEIDATVFPSLGSALGCIALMTEITRKPGFIPGATWLVECDAGCVASVQGVTTQPGLGAIQNLGVMPGSRGKGIGEALLLRALVGFRDAGMGRAMLEVTAQNDTAVRLYRRIGFRARKTIYKAVDATGALV